MNVSTERYLKWRAEKPEMQAGKACDAICYAPFTSLLLDPKGYVRTCCQSMMHSIGNITQSSLREIWDGHLNREMRELMTRNDLPAGCLTCQSDIDKGNFEQTFARLFDVFPVPEVQPAWPQNIWFLTSNACNLECVQCYGELSSSIRKNRDNLPPLKRVYHDAFFEELRDFLPHLRLALFLGGEAFLSRENFRIWDMMIEDGLSTQSLIVTNGTQFNERIVRVLSSLPCSVSISLDGATKETVESIRLNARFDDMLANIRNIQPYANVELSFCIMPQNHHEFGDFLVLAEEMGCDASANIVYQPAEFSICGLPPDDMARVVDQWEARDDEMRRKLDRHRVLWESELNRLKGWVEHRESPPGPLYLTSIAPRLNIAPAAPPVMTKEGARAALVEWSGGGAVHEATLNDSDIFHCSAPTFSGVESRLINDRALSIVLMLLRERYGEDVDVLSEEWSGATMDRTMMFTNLERKRTEMRWHVLPDAGEASSRRLLLLATREAAALPVGHLPQHRPDDNVIASTSALGTDGSHDVYSPGGAITQQASLPDSGLLAGLTEARAQITEKRWLDASRILQRLCAVHDKEVEPFRLLGLTGAALQDWTLSATGFAGAVERGLVSHEVWAGLAQAMTGLGQLDGARKAFDAAIAIGSANAETHGNYAIALVHLGELEAALEQLAQAVALGASHENADRAGALLREGRTEEALALLERQSAAMGMPAG